VRVGETQISIRGRCGSRAFSCSVAFAFEPSRLVGILAQADVAAEAKEKAVGEMVEEISNSPSGPRL